MYSVSFSLIMHLSNIDSSMLKFFAVLIIFVVDDFAENHRGSSTRRENQSFYSFFDGKLVLACSHARDFRLLFKKPRMKEPSTTLLAFGCFW